MITLSESIQKSLFFIGAGASFDAKCKMSIEMLTDLKNRISNDTDTIFTKPEKETIKFLLSCLEYHSEWRTNETVGNIKFTPNIEELALLVRRIKNRESFLPYPITGNWADKLIKLESDYDNLQDEEKIKTNLFSSIEIKLKNILLPDWLKPINYDFLNPISDLFQAFPNELFKLDIFSINNDMVLENYFNSKDITPWRGFVSQKWVGVDTDPDEPDLGRINLFKLHGSLDWVKLTSGEIIENKDTIDEDDFDNIDQNHNPYVIFGQGTKSFSIEPFFSLIQHFKKKLTEKSYIFIIGYSFFDPYINNLLLESVRGTSKRLIIVNPKFGPEKIKYSIKYSKRLQTEDLDNSGIKKVKYPSGTSAIDLANYIEEIQKNLFYSEMPEFNEHKINAKTLEFLPIKTSEFMDDYFGNNGDLLIKLIDIYESERRSEEPFN